MKKVKYRVIEYPSTVGDEIYYLTQKKHLFGWKDIEIFQTKENAIISINPKVIFSI